MKTLKRDVKHAKCCFVSLSLPESNKTANVKSTANCEIAAAFRRTDINTAERNKAQISSQPH